MADRRVLITGVNGFIGSHLANRFLDAGWEVRGLVRATSDQSFLRGKSLELVVGDVTHRASLDAAMGGVEVVVHVAGLASDWGQWARFHAVNVQGTMHAAESARIHGVRRFVQISSAAVHGFEGARDRTEAAPMAPSRFSYVESKRLAEVWLFEFARRHRFEVVAIRPGNVYGPRDHTFIRKYADAIRAGKGGYVSGGRARTCPTYVENLAGAVLLAADHPAASGEAFLITDGLDIDWRTFTDKLVAAAGLPRPRWSVPFWIGYPLAAAVEVIYRLCRSRTPPLLTRYRICNGGRDYHFDISKARKALGFTPAVGLDEALQRTAAWLKQESR